MQPYLRPVTYGIDLTGQDLVIVRKRRGNKSPTEVLFNQNLTKQPELAQAIIETLQREQATGQAAICAALPNADASLRWVHTPLTSKTKARKVLPALLDIQLPFALATCQYDFLDEHTLPEGQISALAIAAPRPGIHRRLDQLQEHGIDPLLLDHEAIALWNQSIEELPPDPNGIRLVSFIKHHQLTLVLGAGEQLRYAHTNRTGTDMLDHNPTPPLTRLLQRLKQIFHAHKLDPTQTPLQWLWCGNMPEKAEWPHAFETALRADYPEAGVHVHHEPQTFLARALAGQPARKRHIQFRTGEILHPDATHFNTRRTHRTAAVLALSGILLGGSAFGAKWWLEKKAGHLQARLTQKAKTLSGLPYVDKGMERIITERNWLEQRKHYAPFTRAFEADAGQLTQRLLASAAQTGLHFHEITIEEHTCTLTGTLTDPAALKEITTFLEQNGYAITQAPPSTSPTGRATFKLRGKRDRES